MTKIGNALKRFLSVSLCAAVTCGCAVFGGTFVSAATVNEQESNDTMETATAITIGDTINGSITDDEEDDYFKIVLPTSGEVIIDLTAQIDRLNFAFYDSDGYCLYSWWESESGGESWRNGDCLLWNSESKKILFNFDDDFTAGTYYIRLNKRWKSVGDYSFTTKFISSNESFKESAWGDNNSMAEADTIVTGKEYRGQIADNDEYDYYKIDLSSSGTLSAQLTANIRRLNICIYDSDGNNLYSKWESESGGENWRNGDCLIWNDITQLIKESFSVNLNKGTYYICLKRRYLNSGNYTINLSFNSAKESFTETGWGINNDLQTASAIKIDKSYKGVIATNDETDYYKVTINKAANYKLSYKSDFTLNYYVYNSNGEEIYSRADRNKVPWNDISNNVTFSDSVFFNKGTYYLRFTRDGTGFYSFKVASPTPTSVKLNKTSCNINIGKSTTLKATVNPSEAFNKSVKWSTSNKKVATVDSKGKVKAVAKGTATITATTSNGKKATCKVTVKIPATKVKLNKTKATLKAGKTLTLKATMTPKNTTDKLIWTSSNKKVATVKNGKITAKKAGKTTITVKTTSGKKATCKITVKKK